MSRTLSAFFICCIIVASIIVTLSSTSVEATHLKNGLSKQDRESLLAKAKLTNLHKRLRLHPDGNTNRRQEQNAIGEGSPAPQPPIIQATSQVIMISNFCANSSLFYDSWQSDLTYGGFEFPPAEEIKTGESETFSAVPDPGNKNDEMQGNVLYYGDGFVITIEFGLEKGEWFLDVSYPTISDVALVGAVEVGRRAFYNVITGGKQPGGNPSQC